jgi:uroporphyrinogen-III decarboxylase
MSEMTGRERLLRAFHQQPTDCIPVAPFIHVNYVKEFFGSHDVDWVEKTPEVYRHFGFDVIHRNCTPTYPAYGPAGPGWDVELSTQEADRNSITTTRMHTTRGDLRCVEALNWVYEFDAESAPMEYPVKSEADFDLFVRYQPPIGEIDTSGIRRARAIVGDAGIVAPWMQGAFNLLAIYYRKLDDLLMDALTNPGFYAGMLEYFLARYKPYVQQMIDAGVDVLSYAGNIANAKLVGPDFYQKYIWPHEKELIAFIQNQGVVVLYHNCGYARNLLPLYPSLGLGAYESLTPPPYGDTILEHAVRTFGAGTTLSGNIDQITLLRQGAKDEIDGAVKGVLDTVRRRCPFILATTDYFNENTPHDSIHWLSEAGRRYGTL